MIKYLGYEDLSPKYDAYNVTVAFPFSNEKNAAGMNVATVFVSPDVFELNFKDVEVGSDLPYHVGFRYTTYKSPQNGIYKPYFML